MKNLTCVFSNEHGFIAIDPSEPFLYKLFKHGESESEADYPKSEAVLDKLIKFLESWS